MVTLRHDRCAELKREKVGVLRYRRRVDHPAWRVRSKWLALLFLVAAGVVAWQFARQQPSSQLSLSGKLESGVPGRQHDDYALHDSKAFGRGVGRLVYPYSVIRGGVLNPDELKHAMEYDPVVSKHFRGFDYQRAHLVKLTEEQAMYVSYRIGDRVYWTRRKVSLHRGETLITDGAIVVRARCGNRVAPAPLDTGSLLEPSAYEFEQPYIPRDPAPTPPVLATATPAPDKVPPAVITPVKGGGWWFIPPFAYIPSGGSGGPLAVTPEPGSLLLISSGLAAVYWRSRKARRKRKK